MAKFSREREIRQDYKFFAKVTRDYLLHRHCRDESFESLATSEDIFFFLIRVTNRFTLLVTRKGIIIFFGNNNLHDVKRFVSENLLDGGG